MFHVLISCFEPYLEFPLNASQLAVERAQTFPVPEALEVRWRTYPVDFDAVPKLVAEDLVGCDAAVHVGQAPGSRALRLETCGVNYHRRPGSGVAGPLDDDGPAELHSRLPLSAWALRLTDHGLSANVSNDAGDYLCNAVLYHSLLNMHRCSLPLLAFFLHVPLAPGQGDPHVPVESTAEAIRLLLQWIHEDISPGDSLS